MIKQVPTYAKFLKDLCTVKRGLHVTKNAFLTEQVSAIIQSKSPVKYKDPGCPTISVNIGGTHVEKALLDLGASVNLLPYSVYKQLGLGGLKPTAITLSLGGGHQNPKGHLHPEEEEGLEEVCLINTLVEEHCDKNLQESLNESLEMFEEGLPEPSDVVFSSSNAQFLLHFSQHLSSDHPIPSLSPFSSSFPTLTPQSSERAAVRAPLDAPPHLADSAPQSRYHTRRASATPVAPTQIPPRGPPTKKAKTSEPGESSRAPRDSQSQPPSTRRPRPSSPIEGNSDCRSRAFHVEAYFDHTVLRQQTELRDSYRLLERYHLVPFMTPPQFFYPRVALDFYQSMTTRGVPIAEAFHIPYAPADPAAFRRWAPLSEWDMHRVQRRGAILEALFRISEGYYFGPHHLIMVALLHFEEKVHKRRLTRAASIHFPYRYAMFWRIWVFLQTLSLSPTAIVESFSLEQWNRYGSIKHSRTSRAKGSPSRPSTSAPSSLQADHPMPHPLLLPPREPPITIPSAHLGLLPPAPPVEMSSSVPAEDPSYPPEDTLLSGGITSSLLLSLAFRTLGTMFILVGGRVEEVIC
ncbi:hypothetical protein AAG906_008992 [Vitis piasezkii]